MKASFKERLISIGVVIALLIGMYIFYSIQIDRARKLGYIQGKAETTLIESEKAINEIQRNLSLIEENLSEYKQTYDEYMEVTSNVRKKIDDLVNSLGSLDSNIDRLYMLWSGE
jgi:ABC-type bacteriocin/lantibiotic exporter with double-glycine peptidase domain